MSEDEKNGENCRKEDTSENKDKMDEEKNESKVKRGKFECDKKERISARAADEMENEKKR